MDNSKRFSCTVVHPGLFPAYFLDPLNPPKIKVMTEVGVDKLSFLSVPSSGKHKILGSVPLGNIGNVTINHLTGDAQRLEILQKSLLRMSVVAAIITVLVLLGRTYGLGYSILFGLIVASVSGLLNFLFNGGFAIKKDLVRFHFTSLEGRSFFWRLNRRMSRMSIRRCCPLA